MFVAFLCSQVEEERTSGLLLRAQAKKRKCCSVFCCAEGVWCVGCCYVEVYCIKRKGIVLNVRLQLKENGA